MSFGFGMGGKRDGTLVLAIVLTVLFLAAIVGMYVMIANGMSNAYRDIYGDATPDPATVAESIEAPLYDGGDGRTTTRVALLLTATDDSPEGGMIASPDEAVNYLYYTRSKRRIIVTVMGRGRTSPVMTVIGPDGSVLARHENDDGDSKVEIQVDLPTEGYYTIRVSANTVDPTIHAANYSLEFATPGYFSPWEWEKLLYIVPVVVLVLILVVGVFGKISGVPVEELIIELRWFFRQSTGFPDPPDPIHTFPPRTALVQYLPPEDASEPETVRDEIPAAPVNDLYFGLRLAEDMDKQDIDKEDMDKEDVAEDDI